MSGAFDSSVDSYLSFTADGASAIGSGGFTIAVLWRPAGVNCGFANAQRSGSGARALLMDAGHIFGGYDDFSSGFGTYAANIWYLIAVTKAAGSNPYRLHVWPYAADGSGTMDHGVAASGVANHGDGTAVDELRIGATADRASGLGAVTGFWTRPLSDAELDSMRSNRLAAWKAVSGGQPAVLIDLENWNGSTGAAVKVGSATLNGVTGNVTSGANPPGFDFSLGITQALPMATETDTALTPGRAKRRTLALAAETDTAPVVGRVKIRALTTATEAAVAPGFGRVKSRALSLAAEGGAAGLMTALKSRALPAAVEHDTALTIGGAPVVSPVPAYTHVVTAPLVHTVAAPLVHTVAAPLVHVAT